MRPVRNLGEINAKFNFGPWGQKGSWRATVVFQVNG
ncbi:rCG26523 [Rattus norvegicus]|uniref:RCG26523 n=1 Tax=Rattus norvegicus TaxID=10116 RepID=A6HME4_RAT|nr:rCG26523 [Rattus norvegicus]